jgi:hypothetical protein
VNCPSTKGTRLSVKQQPPFRFCHGSTEVATSPVAATMPPPPTICTIKSTNIGRATAPNYARRFSRHAPSHMTRRLFWASIYRMYRHLADNLKICSIATNQYQRGLQAGLQANTRDTYSTAGTYYRRHHADPNPAPDRMHSDTVTCIRHRIERKPDLPVCFQ